MTEHSEMHHAAASQSEASGGASHGGIAASHALTCLEVWNGSGVAETSVSVPGLDTWVYSKPYHGSAEGGDIHYVSMCAAGLIARFVIADVSGHGTDVAALSGTLRTLMRRHINTLDQTRFAQALNDSFSALESQGRFATAVLATYYAPTDHLVVCNAGHPRPLWYSAERGEWSLLDESRTAEDARGAPRNLPLGIIEPTEYVQFAVSLSKGDIVVLYTDSLMEAADAAGVQIGEEGLLGLARSLDVLRPERIEGELRGLVARHRGSEELEDDATVLVIHHNAGDPPRQGIAEKLRVAAKMLGLAATGPSTRPSGAR